MLGSLGKDFKLSELMCRSGVVFRLYIHRGPHLSGIGGRWFMSALDYRSWDPFGLLARYTGYAARPLGDLSIDEAWSRVKKSLEKGRPLIARRLDKVWQPCLVIGCDESGGKRSLRLRCKPGEVREQEFVIDEKGPPFNRWIRDMLLVKKAGDRNRKYKIAPLLALAVRLAREGESGDGKYSAGLAAYADWVGSLRGNVRSVMGFDPSGLYRVQFTATMLDDLEERRRMAAEYLTSQSEETTAIHAGGLYSEIASVLSDSRAWFPRPCEERFEEARDALMDPVKRSRLADAIEKAAELERRAVEKMEEMVGPGKQAARINQA